MLLFLQMFKKIVKEKINILILIILVIFSLMFISVSWIVNTRLNDAYNFMGRGTFHYDYLLRYSSKKKRTNGIETITPWFVFDNEYHEIIDSFGNRYTLPFLSLGINGALQLLDINKINVNFSFMDDDDDMKVSNIEFIAKNKLLGLNYYNDGLYNFNINSDNFRTSLIGELYLSKRYKVNRKNCQKILNNINLFMNNFVRSDISKSTIRLFVNYLNNKYQKPKLEYYNNKDKFINNLLDFINNGKKKWIKNVDLKKSSLLVDDIPNSLNIENSIFDNGLNGNLSILYKKTKKESISDETNLTSFGIYYGFDFLNQKNENILPNFNCYLEDAAFAINDFYNINNINSDFNDKRSDYGPYSFTKSYYLLLGEVSDFDLRIREAYECWDLLNNIKYKIINWKQLVEYDQLKILYRYKDFNFDNLLNSVYVVVSPQFAKSHKLKLGNLITIGKNNDFYIGAIGGDVANIYPIIYDVDIFPDSDIDVIIYVSPVIYRNNFKIFDVNDIEEDNVIYISYIGNGVKSESFDIFKKYLADDYKNLNNLGNNRFTKIKSLNDTKLIYCRYSLLGTAIKIYNYLSIMAILVFLLILIFTLLILIKKIIKQEKTEIGILKANGYSNKYIASSYLVYAFIMVIIGAPIGWFFGVILQLPIMNIFNKYFVIPNVILFDLLPLIFGFIIVSFIIVLTIWLTAINQLAVSPLNLLLNNNNNGNIVPNKLFERFFLKIKFKKFINKFRFIIISVSIKKIINFFITFLFASIVLTFSVFIPASINKISKSYYSNMKYCNEYQYNNVIGNIPFTRYQLYTWNGPRALNRFDYPICRNSLIPDYLNIGSVNKQIWLSTSSNEIIGNPEKYSKFLEDMILFNFMVGKGSSLSIGSLYEVSQRFKPKNPKDLNIIEEQIQILLSNILPRVFKKNVFLPVDKDLIEKWSYYMTYIMNDFLPSKIRNMWLKDNYAKLQFVFTFGTSTYNSLNEDVFTGFNSKIKLKNNNYIDLFTYGINNNNKTIIFPSEKIKDSIFKYKNNFYKNISNYCSNDKLYNDNNEIPMIINYSAKKKYSLNVGDVIYSKVPFKQLKYMSRYGLKTINNNWWGYINNINSDSHEKNFIINNKIDPFKINLTKLTIGKKQNNLYAFNENGKIKKYYNIANFSLKIPVFDIDLSKWTSTVSETTGRILPELFCTTNNEQNVVYKKNDYYIIRPFDNKFDCEIKGIGDLIGGFPTNWYRSAFKAGLLIISEDYKNVKYKITGIQESYDFPRAYISQENANNLLNYPNDVIKLYANDNYSNPLSWFNGKFSKYVDNVDQTMRYNLSSFNGSYSMLDFINNSLEDSIAKADYLNIKNQVIKKLAIISIYLSIIFIIITMITAIITIYIVTESFINEFIKFITIMRSMGYSNWEVNSLILKIFTPFVIIAWGIGIEIVWLLFKIGIYEYFKLSLIIMPLQFSWLIIPFTFILISIIYIFSYWILVRKINFMTIQKQIMINKI